MLGTNDRQNFTYFVLILTRTHTSTYEQEMDNFQVQQFNYHTNNPPNPPGDERVGDVGESNNDNNAAQNSCGGNDTTTTIWGTQPPLDPALLDIQKIAVLTRKIFGSDDLTNFIPKV